MILLSRAAVAALVSRGISGPKVSGLRPGSKPGNPVRQANHQRDTGAHLSTDPVVVLYWSCIVPLLAGVFAASGCVAVTWMLQRTSPRRRGLPLPSGRSGPLSPALDHRGARWSNRSVVLRKAPLEHCYALAHRV